MSAQELPFIPASAGALPLPLERFLPPLPYGMVSRWLQERLPAGAWVIDPLGSTPALPLEAAQAGYRVFVSVNNPVISFILETLAAAPQKSGFLAALAELDSIRRGSERLEIYLKSLYETECASCNQIIQPQAFLWRRDEKQPFARLYECPHCGDQGERIITPRDIERLNRVGNDALHRSRAVERIRLEEGPVEPAADEAIRAYLPRPLDFLITVLNKIEGPSISKERRRLLTALALSACDEGSALWSWPNVRSRPRQLVIPPQFRENNLWLAFENAIADWSFLKEPVPLSLWPDLPPPEGGICLFRGRIKSLPTLQEEINMQAAVTVIPRPSQAFWTLCAVWSGWIWGKEAVLPLRRALGRRRYDWNWHAAALHSALHSLANLAPEGLPIFGVLPELTPGFLSAVFTGYEAAGVHLESIAHLPDQEIMQMHWKTRKTASPPKINREGISIACKKAVETELLERNQPAAYTELFAASLAGLSHDNQIPSNRPAPNLNFMNEFQTRFDQILKDTSFVLRGGSHTQSIEGGFWWLARPGDLKTLPLADRVEMEVVRFLQKNPDCTMIEIQSGIFPLFPGLKTPPVGLIQACLDSYGEIVEKEPAVHWHLRASESAAQRRQDIDEVQTLLSNLAPRLGVTCREKDGVDWVDDAGNVICHFYPFASSIISRYVFQPQEPSPVPQVLVLPGSRSNLLAYKLREDPRLAKAVSKRWCFLKFRHLRRICEQKNLTLARFFDLLNQDPPLLEELKQMTLL